MKTFITRKTTLIAISGIAAAGLAGLSAQDEPGKATDKDKRPDTVRTQEAAQEETFRGQLVSLTTYLGKHHDWKTDKAGKSKEDAEGSAIKERGETSSASKAMSMAYQPLGLLVDTGTDIDVDIDVDREGETDRNRDEASARSTERKDRAVDTPEVQQLCVLLFSPDNQELAAKAKALCRSDDDVTAKKTDARADESADAAGEEKASETDAALGAQGKHTFKVKVTGKKVMRHGLTAIFVEDIDGTPLSAQN